jgi:hypothetical protein
MIFWETGFLAGGVETANTVIALLGIFFFLAPVFLTDSRLSRAELGLWWAITGLIALGGIVGLLVVVVVFLVTVYVHYHRNSK